MANYTKNPEYIAAFNKVQELNNKVYGYKGYANGLDAQLENIAQAKGENSKEFKQAQAEFLKLKAELESAKKKVNSIKNAATKEETAAKTAKDKANFEKEKTSKTSDLDYQLGIARRQGDAAKVTELQSKIDAIKGQTFEESPAAGGTVTGDGTNKSTRDYAKELSTAAPVVLSMDDPGRLKLAQSLNAAGYKVPNTGVYNDQLVAAYQQAVSANQIRNTNLAAAKLPELSFDDFLKIRQSEPDVTGAGGTGKGATSTSTSISAPTEAAGTIQSVFKSVLGRDATAKEVKTLTKQLTDAEKNNPTKTKTDANGNVVYTGGINREQFLTDILKGSEEFGTKKAAAAKTIESQIAETAMDNNVTTSPSQLSTWAKRVQNGEDLKTIQQEIRNTASLGYSDQIKKLLSSGTDLSTILSPYKRAMADTLGINEQTIGVNDPTLHMAIANPDGKEMSLFEYQTHLRKDPRWQFTDQARSEAADVAQKVLKDFGFMG